MGYNLRINGVHWGCNPLTNLLLTSWHIQVGVGWKLVRCCWRVEISCSLLTNGGFIGVIISPTDPITIDPIFLGHPSMGDHIMKQPTQGRWFVALDFSAARILELFGHCPNWKRSYHLNRWGGKAVLKQTSKKLIFWSKGPLSYG